MEHIEANKIFIYRSTARKIKKAIGNAGFITHINEVSRKKIGEVDLFRIVLYSEDLIAPIEKIINERVDWKTITKK